MLREPSVDVKQACYSAARMSDVERRVAIDAARAAGRLLHDARSRARQIAYKGAPTNLVTEMDARAEALVLDHLRRAFPADAVLAEESGARARQLGTALDRRSARRHHELRARVPDLRGVDRT